MNAQYKCQPLYCTLSATCPFSRCISPKMADKREDLPAPTGPTTATSCPSFTSRLMLKYFVEDYTSQLRVSRVRSDEYKDNTVHIMLIILSFWIFVSQRQQAWSLDMYLYQAPKVEISFFVLIYLMFLCAVYIPYFPFPCAINLLLESWDFVSFPSKTRIFHGNRNTCKSRIKKNNKKML